MNRKRKVIKRKSPKRNFVVGYKVQVPGRTYLDDMIVSELKLEAKKLGCKGISKLRKDELIKAIINCKKL